MLIDLTLKVPASMVARLSDLEKRIPFGHLGTHFDVMNKEFPLFYLRREGIVFDVAEVRDRDIDVCDIDPARIEQEMFVAFYSGLAGRCAYGTQEYFKTHPQLSVGLIEKLIEKGISIIGIDFAGVRRGSEHTPMDQYCADHGVFIVENLCNLDRLLQNRDSSTFIANTYPVNFEGMTGLPCRVVAEV